MAKMREIQGKGYLRACEALRLRRAGLTFKAIGEQLGNVTSERAKQLVRKGERIERYPEHFGGRPEFLINAILSDFLYNKGDNKVPELSQRGQDWQEFSAKVLEHIENYTVPQYGDKGSDIASEYTADYCVRQIAKYAARFGRNSREGQEQLDLMKIAHYAQMAWQSEQEKKQ